MRQATVKLLRRYARLRQANGETMVRAFQRLDARNQERSLRAMRRALDPDAAIAPPAEELVNG